MPTGLYAYCILGSGKLRTQPILGIGGQPVFTVSYKDVGAVVSKVLIKKMNPDVDDAVAHNKVVDAVREQATAIPIRFGVIFKSVDGIRKLLKTSYEEYRSTIKRLTDKDEYGLKVMAEKDAMHRFEAVIQKESKEYKEIADEMARAGRGESYFLQLRLNDVLKTEAQARLEKVGEEIHQALTAATHENRLLPSDMDEVVLNATYLVGKVRSRGFEEKVSSLKTKYQPLGFTLHISGPWAPYSFC